MYSSELPLELVCVFLTSEVPPLLGGRSGVTTAKVVGRVTNARDGAGSAVAVFVFRPGTVPL